MALADFFITVLTFITVYGIFALGLNVKFGYTGLIDFGHVIYFMIGAYVTVVLTSPPVMAEYEGLGGFALPAVVGGAVPFGSPLGWAFGVAVAMVAASLVAVLIGLLTIRLREDYLAITALGLSVILQSVVNNERWLFNGSFGVREIHRPLGGAFPLSLGSLEANVAVFGLASLATFGYGYYRAGRYVRAMSRREAKLVTALAAALGLSMFGLIVGGAGLGLAGAGLLVAAWLGRRLAGTGVPSLRPTLALLGVELFSLWYFVFPTVLRGPAELFANVLWLFDPGATAVGGLDYDRFFLLASAAVLAGAYRWTQTTIMSPFGRVLVAIREDEDVARSVGKSTFVFKIESFVLGSALAGLAGALWAVTIGFVDPTQFGPLITFFAFVAVIIGGTANNKGVILGTAVFWLINSGTRFLDDYIAVRASARLASLRIVLIGVLLIVILYYRPEGLLGEQRRLEHTDAGRSTAGGGGSSAD